MIIRPYQPTDKARLLEVFRRNTPKYFAKTEAQDFEKYLDKKGSTYLAIETEGKIIGGTGYDINKQDKSGNIVWIFIDPDHSGQGFGKQAVEYCLTILKKDKDVKKMTVRTSQFAFKFFETFGYVTQRIEKNYWAAGFDLYEMKKEFIK